jgi:rhodanese-related sulfurtransferase
MVKTEDVHDLKSRLEWGQPAFTILDVRDRHTYNESHILGAMPMPLDGLATRAKTSLHKARHLFVYGENDTETAQAAQTLRNAGFDLVSELKGGLAAWKTIGGAIEGVNP